MTHSRPGVLLACGEDNDPVGDDSPASAQRREA